MTKTNMTVVEQAGDDRTQLSPRGLWGKEAGNALKAPKARRQEGLPPRRRRPRVEPIRAMLVARIREDIRLGRYDLAARLPRALERLIEDLKRAPSA